MKISTNFMKKCGIYSLTINDKVYVGSSKNIYQRLHRHKSDLLNNRHRNPILTNYYIKYGIDKFVTGIIKECSEEDLLTLEQYYINKLGVLNCQKTPIRPTITDDMKIKISNTLKRKYSSGEIKRAKVTKIFQYSINGIFIKKWDAVVDATTFYNGIGNKLLRAVRLNRTYKGFYWSREFVECYDIPKYKNKTGVKVTNVETNEVFTFKSVTECARILQIKLESVNYCLNKSKSHIYKSLYKIEPGSV